MPSASPIKFRCFQCHKLLGVSRSKAGAVVACPGCLAELIVPDDPESPDMPVVRLTDTPTSSWPHATDVRIEPSVVPWDAPPDPSSAEQSIFPVVEVEPISLRPDPPSRVRSAMRAKAARAAPEDAQGREEIAAELESNAFAIDVGAEDGRSPARVDSPTLRDQAARRNDVVLPRTVVALWSFLVLLAVVFAFLAGLLVGRSL